VGGILIPAKQLALTATSVFLSSLAFFFGIGLHPVWWLLWIAPIPVLVAAPHLSVRWSLAAALLAWTGGALNMWTYYHTAIEIPVSVTLLITVGPAALFGLAVLAFRWAIRSRLWKAALIFPSLWTAYEFVSERMSPHCTFGNVSYSQMDFLPVVQLASVTGIWGITFCVFLFAAAVSALFSGRGTESDRRRLGLIAGLMLAAVLGLGEWRIRSEQTQSTVKVALVASDLKQNVFPRERDQASRLLHDYANQAGMLAREGPAVIVLPEKIAVVSDSELPELDTRFRSIADKTGSTIVLGVVHPSGRDKWNEARVYSQDGAIRTYQKHHMVPSFESDLRVGTTRTSWNEPSGKWGVAICKDMDFPALSREYGNDGSGLLLVPAWDFDVDGWLHSRMAILRGVESGYSIVRAPKQGVLTVSDDKGRVLASKATNLQPFTSLLAEIPVRHQPTVYAQFGDWFGWLNLFVLAFVITSTMAGRKRHVSTA
jgi:apolipoprotein N-acyltransferase